MIDGTMYDNKVSVVLCKCGKKALHVIVGKNKQIAYCDKCSPFENLASDFVYRKPTLCTEVFPITRDRKWISRREAEKYWPIQESKNEILD